jgi:hypothetical protein
VDRGLEVAVVDEHPRLDAAALRELSRRLESYGRCVDLGADWTRGVPGQWLDELLADWRDFDVHAFQRRLDALDHRRAETAGHAVHLTRAEGGGPEPLPLVLTHGWPGSFLEYLPVLDLLTDPPGGTAGIPPTRSR